MLFLVIVVSALVVVGCMATRAIMVRVGRRGLLDGWEEMNNSERDELLRNRCWKHRCLCRLYGYPWKQPITVIGRDGRVHEGTRCYPIAERL